MNKKSNVFRFLWVISLSGTLSGCIHYIGTINVPVNPMSLNEYLLKKPIWTIEDSNKKTKIIGDVRVGKDSISGKLYSPTSIDHPAGKKTYTRRESHHSLSYLHLSTNVAEFSEIINAPLSVISAATTHEKAVGTNLIVNSGLLFGAAVIMAAICNCPYVSAMGPDTTTFQGSLFPGAISKSLERSDHLILKNVSLNQDGKINIKVSNELPEVEYFNQLELYEVDNMQYHHLAQDIFGQPVSYEMQDHLKYAITMNNRDIKNEVQYLEGGLYNFNEQGNDYELNKVFLTFNRKDLGNKALLLLRAKQSKWMNNVAVFTLQQFGTALDNWVQRLDKVDPIKFNQSAIDRGVSLNVYLKRNNQWKYIGSYSNAGTMEYRDMAMSIDLSKSPDENIEIKLEAAHGFWDIDYVGITDTWSENVNLTKLKTLSAVNQEGKNIMQDIEADDHHYTELPVNGNFIDLLFEAPADFNSRLILKGKGYYHHEKEYASKPNYKFLKAVKQNKMTTHQLSRLLLNQMTLEARRVNNP